MVFMALTPEQVQRNAVASNPLAEAAKFIIDFPATIQKVFLTFERVLQSIELGALWFVFILVILLFFVTLFLIIYLPVKSYPFFVRAKALYYKVFEKIGKPYNRDR